MSFGRIILGDNQFLGVNHADQAKASTLYRQFGETDAIIEVIGWAYAAGVRDFMFTTHERYYPVFEEILRARLFPEMGYVPCLPYAHKYANAMAEKGMIEVMLDNVRQTSPLGAVTAVGRAAFGDFSGLMRLLVQIELLLTKGLPVRGVFLQNIFFDLMMGLNATALLESYHRYVSEKLGIVPGYITMNHPMATQLLCDQIGLQQPWLCANFNVAGFRTNPSNEGVSASFGSGRTRNIAMSVFASGALEAERSLAYVLGAKGVDAILFGSSRRENIEKNTRIILGTAPRSSGASG
jgi:hypothetical protein